MPERTLSRSARAPLATGVAGLACAVVAGAQLGGTGVVSALLAAVVVAVFFWSGLLPFLLAGPDAARGGLAMLVLLTNYALRLVLALVLLQAASRAGAVDAQALGVSLVVCALVWTAAQVSLLRGAGAGG